MASQELVPERELAMKYKIGQSMKRLSKEDDCYSLTYAVGQPIKSVGLPRTDQEFKELFVNVGQVLWHLRDNPNFFGYGKNEEQTVFDAMGLKLPSGTTMEAILRKYDGCRSPAVGLSTARGEDGRPLAIPEAGLVYVPRLDSKIKRGILVDLVRAYSKSF